eukprot:gb/GECH01009483.1/.p1 GENE.gb/GECH01009483.1/~~gb/GECH01009483.1/.p1  ORF type:complete len:517 (+),score=29.85 gb/GECH01009483.1/:1-1551(+)
MPFHIPEKHKFQKTSTFTKVNQKLGLNKGETKEKFLAQFTREYQREAIQEVLKKKHDKQNAKLVVLPTGTGKTGVAVTLPYLLSSAHVLVITPNIAISNQIEVAFCGKGENELPFLVRANVISPNDFHMFEPTVRTLANRADPATPGTHDLVIANIQKLSEENFKYHNIDSKTYDFIVVDEAHHYPAPTWKSVINYFTGLKLFLTATPFHDKRHIVQKCSNVGLTYYFSRMEAIRQGVIRDIKFVETGVWADSSYDSQHATALERIYWQIRKHDEEDPKTTHKCLIIAGTTDVARQIADQFNSLTNGTIEAKTYVGSTNEAIKHRFINPDEKQLRVLCLCNKLREGFDMDSVSVLGICRNIARGSHVLFEQFLGRALRRAQGEPQDLSAVVVSPHKYRQKLNFNEYINRGFTFNQEDTEDDQTENQDMDEDINYNVPYEEKPKRVDIDVEVHGETTLEGQCTLSIPTTRTDLLAQLEHYISAYGWEVKISGSTGYMDLPFFIEEWQAGSKLVVFVQ